MLSMSSIPLRSRVRGLVLAVAVALVVIAAPVSTQRPRFYRDDPITRAPETQDASKVASYQQPDMYEMVRNLFFNPGYKPTGVRAQNVNTIDEVPDSSWFTDRIGKGPITIEQLVRGHSSTLRRIRRSGRSSARRPPAPIPASRPATPRASPTSSSSIRPRRPKARRRRWPSPPSSSTPSATTRCSRS